MSFCTLNVHIYITGFLQKVRLSYKSYTDRAWTALHYMESAFWSSMCSCLQLSITTNPPYLPQTAAMKAIIQMGEIRFYYCAYKWWYNMGSRIKNICNYIMSVNVKHMERAGMCNPQCKFESGTLAFLLNRKSAGVEHYKMEQSLYSWIYTISWWGSDTA